MPRKLLRSLKKVSVLTRRQKTGVRKLYKGMRRGNVKGLKGYGSGLTRGKARYIAEATSKGLVKRNVGRAGLGLSLGYGGGQVGYNTINRRKRRR